MNAWKCLPDHGWFRECSPGSLARIDPSAHHCNQLLRGNRSRQSVLRWQACHLDDWLYNSSVPVYCLCTSSCGCFIAKRCFHRTLLHRHTPKSNAGALQNEAMSALCYDAVTIGSLVGPAGNVWCRSLRMCAIALSKLPHGRTIRQHPQHQI